jgi:hypothetical protein
MGDLISVSKIEDQYYQIDDVIEKSKNSTIWVTINIEKKGKDILNIIHQMGCGYEGGVLFGYFTINVPSEVNFDNVMNILEKAEEKDILMHLISSFRH